MSTPVRSAAASLRVFLERIIDYAGLFAPASLDMTTSVKNYSRYLSHPQHWALGRFVLPVARLDEFLHAQENIAAAAQWQLSGIISANIEQDLAAADTFNRRGTGAMIDSVEVCARNLDEIDLVRKNQPHGATVLYEISPEQADELLPAVQRIGGSAKLRTGGVVEDAFPAVEQTAGFIAQCAELGVPFKATAGLHHPLRCIRPLTYEPNSREAMMHGFVNLFTASAIAWSAVRTDDAVPRAALATCLADRERANWHFGEDALTWSGGEKPIRFGLEALRSMRSHFALSFGSCSFEEPLRDMHEIDLL
jgi:hypothetical protein